MSPFSHQFLRLFRHEDFNLVSAKPFLDDLEPPVLDQYGEQPFGLGPAASGGSGVRDPCVFDDYAGVVLPSDVLQTRA